MNTSIPDIEYCMQNRDLPGVLMPWLIVLPGGRLKNAYELLNLRAFKISILYEIISFNVWLDILCGISKGTFEISHKISHPYIERCGFYSQVNI